MDGTLSPDENWVFHGMNWVPAMLSPDEKHYAHEGQWYPILQTPSKTEESNPNFVTKDELHVSIANFLSILLLFLGY